MPLLLIAMASSDVKLTASAANQPVLECGGHTKQPRTTPVRISVLELAMPYYFAVC